MSLQIVRFRTEPDQIPEVEEAAARLFAALEETSPSGIEYTVARVGDTSDFVLTLQLPDGAANSLLDIAEAGAFRARIAEWAGGPVAPNTLHVLGSYNR